jgi:hypothetical protein
MLGGQYNFDELRNTTTKVVYGSNWPVGLPDPLLSLKIGVASLLSSS